MPTVRWNATYYMLKRLVVLREAVHYFCLTHRPDFDEKGFNNQLDILSDDDWLEIGLFIKLLTPFEKLTKRLQGNSGHNGFEGSYGSLWEVIPSLQILDNHLNEAELEYESSIELLPDYSRCIKYGKEKLNQYWQKIIIDDDCPYYSAAAILHPQINLA
jgi:hypothetical protein